jgi:NAD(P)-dependent dehydrogenase (short-subunit alcohol dehydrogenase family)
MRRLATPHDVLGAVRFLLDEESSGFVTGECLTVDGGLRA